MSWLRLTLECNAAYVDVLSKLFEQFDAVAVSSEAMSEEQMYAGVGDDPVYWNRTAVSALFDDSIDLDILLACSRNRIGTDNLTNSRVEVVKDENWIEAHKANHGSTIFAERLCVSPSWILPNHDYPATLVLDPGLAFGSGKHATTALCLDWLARQDLGAKQIIDYGCGSGILGLAAAILGAKKVYAVDIDPQALQATRNNAMANKLEDKINVSSADNAELPIADILLANILLKPLTELAPLISKLVCAKGKIILSGILAVQTEECLAAYSPWFNMSAAVFQDEWALLEGIRLAN
ncbi:MAG: ribosomal protein L11 methyltransferase [Gammaproteobacteria bacterium]|jgi:ribosomal protein L11 methyltransferase